MKFKRKPDTRIVEAIQWDGDTFSTVDALSALGCSFSCMNGNLVIKAGVDGAQGYIPVQLGEWVMKASSPSVHFYPVDDAYMAETFEAIDGTLEEPTADAG